MQRTGPGRHTTIKGHLAREYLAKFPKASTTTLAKMLYRDNKVVFKNIEDARSTLRYWRGASGTRLRKCLSDTSFVRSLHYNSVWNLPQALPIPETEPYIISELPRNMLIISDLHIPYHDNVAIATVLQYGVEHKIEALMFLGDICDFYAISVFEKDPRKRNFVDEINKTKEFFQIIRNVFPHARIWWKLGNHERRYQTYLEIKAPELIGIPEFEINSVFGIADLKIEIIGDKQKIKVGKLNLLHGHEIKSGIIAPVNPARGIYLKTRVNVVVGHWHQTSEHTEFNMNEEIITTFSLGSLCNLRPEYRPINSWNHGFGFVEFDKAGVFNLDNIRIYNGRIL